jgi:hypothetical protein
MADSKRVELLWPAGLVDRIDRERGLVSRSAWMRQAVEKALGGSGSGDTLSVASPRGSGSVKEVAPAEHPASSRAPEPIRLAEKRLRSDGEVVGAALQWGQPHQCPKDCDPAWRPKSPAARCPSCSRSAIPVSSAG